MPETVGHRGGRGPEPGAHFFPGHQDGSGGNSLGDRGARTGSLNSDLNSCAVMIFRGCLVAITGSSGFSVLTSGAFMSEAIGPPPAFVLMCEP